MPIDQESGARVLDYQPVAEKTFKVGSLVYTRRGLAVLFFWLLWGDLCFQLMEQVVSNAGIIPLKLKSLGASNWTMGLIMGTIPSALNMFFNPIISFKSDRYRSRWGRRIPFIVVTMPLLVACLVGVAYGDRLGVALRGWMQDGGSSWVYEGLRSHIAAMSPNQAALLCLATFLTLFAFFNVFVNSVFWYLFNDVVPEQVMGRFISWFRIVLYFKGFLFNLLIFPFAESHFAEIMLGTAALYFLGFGVMCLFVKEGVYPPPPAYVGKTPGTIGAIETYARECSGLWHYWFLFLAGAAMAITWTSGTFYVFYNKAIGLDLTMIGRLGAIGSVAGLIAIPISGWLADKFHPIRVVLWGLMLQVLVATPLGCIWLFWLPSPHVVFWFSAVSGVLIGAPIGALMQMYDPPLLMRIFPRDRYGQFCSANAMCRSLIGIAFGTLTGAYFDLMTKFWGESISYRTLPIFNGVALLLVLVFIYLLYRSWKRYGGDKAYVPPIPASGSEAPQTAPAGPGRH